MAGSHAADPRATCANMFSIRSFHPEDARAVCELAKSSPEAAQWSEQTYQQLGELGIRAWVSTTGGLIDGFLMARTIVPEAEILNVAVAGAQRRNGIATALLAEAENAIRIQQVNRLFLEVRESNEGAIAFYRKRGFAKSGTRPRYYCNPVESAVLMEKELTV
jgi:ribosomal-protein-alanine N-acetyltransferase